MAVGVAQVVQADARQHRLLDRLPPVATDAFGVESLAVLGREHEPGLDPGFIPLRLLLELACRLALQHFDRAGV